METAWRGGGAEPVFCGSSGRERRDNGGGWKLKNLGSIAPGTVAAVGFEAPFDLRGGGGIAGPAGEFEGLFGGAARVLEPAIGGTGGGEPVPVVVGLWGLVRSPGMRLVAALFLATFAIHSLMRVVGAFGAAGYSRYFSAFAPCLAIAGCVGWNHLAAWFPRVFGKPVVWAAVAAISIGLNLVWVDGAAWHRDARAVASAKRHFDSAHAGLEVRRFVWSQAFMAILWERDPWEKPGFPMGQREEALEILRALPPGTLACWDAETGRALHGLTAQDLQDAGFHLLHQETHTLKGWLPPLLSRWGWGGDRTQTIYLLYKEIRET